MAVVLWAAHKRFVPLRARVIRSSHLSIHPVGPVDLEKFNPMQLVPRFPAAGIIPCCRAGQVFHSESEYWPVDPDIAESE